MKNTIIIKNENNEDVEVEILIGFKIERIGKEYIAYTFNDDDISEEVNVFISEIKYDNNTPYIVPIKEDEKEMVLAFYNELRKAN